MWGGIVPWIDSPSAAAFGLFWKLGFRLSVALAIFLSVGNGSAIAGGPPVQVIGNDRGGSVLERARRVQAYEVAGTRVEIRGSHCMSACTMLLGVTNVCVAADTVFGFHGPSSPIYGVSLDPVGFERWSNLMATHYPEPIRSWFLSEGRHRTVGFHRFFGRDLIKLGVPNCA